MDFRQIIIKKRNGEALSKQEIEYTVKGISQETIPDYQIAAWAMAVYFQGMNERETDDLTLAMAYSGQVLDLKAINGVCVDKHSTGGVGDKTTMVVIPLVAAAGVPVAKMSGRGLGHTGGTIDKFESIPGFQVNMDEPNFLEQVNRVKAAVIAQSGNLVPADKKLYALRDVTGTVDSLPLIASSIMSKKIAAGAQGIVLDVKVGSGAFMKDVQAARQLAVAMVRIGKNFGRRLVAVLSANEQPLGWAIGNSLEVREAIAVLQGKGPADLLDLSITLAAHMLVLGKAFESYEKAWLWSKEAIRSGLALDKFKEMVAAQGGVLDWKARDYGLPAAEHLFTLEADQAGYVRDLNAYTLGNIAMRLGAGRQKLTDQIDHRVGIELMVKNHQKVKPGQLMARIHASSKEKGQEAQEALKTAFSILPQPGIPSALILDTLT